MGRHFEVVRWSFYILQTGLRQTTNRARSTILPLWVPINLVQSRYSQSRELRSSSMIYTRIDPRPFSRSST